MLSGQGDRNSEEDGMMVRYHQVKALQLGGGCASGGNQIQFVAFGVVGTLNMFCNVEAVQ